MSRPSARPREPRLIEVSSEAPDRDTALGALVAELRQHADGFVFLSGGASKMDAGAQRQLLSMFHALATLADEGRRFAVGDGGTQAGVMEAAGAARLASGGAFPLVGVAPASEIPPRGDTPIDPNHSHIVAVNGPGLTGSDGWGSEIATMYWLFDRLAVGRPSVAVVANGGANTLREVAANVQAGRRMILVEGSGRAADAVVSLLEGTPAADGEVGELRDRAQADGLARHPELFRLVALATGAAGLQTALARALDGLDGAPRQRPV